MRFRARRFVNAETAFPNEFPYGNRSLRAADDGIRTHTSLFARTDFKSGNLTLPFTVTEARSPDPLGIGNVLLGNRQNHLIWNQKIRGVRSTLFVS
jgi:hypothetical protein